MDVKWNATIFIEWIVLGDWISEPRLTTDECSIPQGNQNIAMPKQQVPKSSRNEQTTENLHDRNTMKIRGGGGD